ncbi:MAG: hypothetical protein HY582_03440, partial [Candidatus Omnitrophica bacterium]|nr:hypothetical protein [Candidatus Omnitrophota bacterium]
QIAQQPEAGSILSYPWNFLFPLFIYLAALVIPKGKVPGTEKLAPHPTLSPSGGEEKGEEVLLHVPWAVRVSNVLRQIRETKDEATRFQLIRANLADIREWLYPIFGVTYDTRPNAPFSSYTYSSQYRDGIAEVALEALDEQSVLFSTNDFHDSFRKAMGDIGTALPVPFPSEKAFLLGQKSYDQILAFIQKMFKKRQNTKTRIWEDDEIDFLSAFIPKLPEPVLLHEFPKPSSWEFPFLLPYRDSFTFNSSGAFQRKLIQLLYSHEIRTNTIASKRARQLRFDNGGNVWLAPRRFSLSKNDKRALSGFTLENVAKLVTLKNPERELSPETRALVDWIENPETVEITHRSELRVNKAVAPDFQWLDLENLVPNSLRSLGTFEQPEDALMAEFRKGDGFERLKSGGASDDLGRYKQFPTMREGKELSKFPSHTSPFLSWLSFIGAGGVAHDVSFYIVQKDIRPGPWRQLKGFRSVRLALAFFNLLFPWAKKTNPTGIISQGSKISQFESTMEMRQKSLMQTLPQTGFWNNPLWFDQPLSVDPAQTYLKGLIDIAYSPILTPYIITYIFLSQYIFRERRSRSELRTENLENVPQVIRQMKKATRLRDLVFLIREAREAEIDTNRVVKTLEQIKRIGRIRFIWKQIAQQPEAGSILSYPWNFLFPLFIYLAALVIPIGGAGLTFMVGHPVLAVIQIPIFGFSVFITYKRLRDFSRGYQLWQLRLGRLIQTLNREIEITNQDKATGKKGAISSTEVRGGLKTNSEIAQAILGKIRQAPPHAKIIFSMLPAGETESYFDVGYEGEKVYRKNKKGEEIIDHHSLLLDEEETIFGDQAIRGDVRLAESGELQIELKIPMLDSNHYQDHRYRIGSLFEGSAVFLAINDLIISAYQLVAGEFSPEAKFSMNESENPNVKRFHPKLFSSQTLGDVAALPLLNANHTPDPTVTYTFVSRSELR